ncbi:MAG: hypothetical protein O7F76_13975 [Planctomycetota bacterium]|nr:hypothetical protein [Planctomycetota bacterium]
MNQHAKQNAVWAGIAALLMLYYGWGTGGWLIPANSTAFFEATFNWFDWMLKIGGICMAVVAVLCFLGLRVALLIDVVVSGLCGSILILCPVYWMFIVGPGLQNIVFVIFGGMFVNTARGCWTAYRESGGTVGTATRKQGGLFGVEPLAPPVTPPPPEPTHPASIRPDALPKDDEPPPPEGFLAALAKEKDEPPRASFE